MNRAVATRSAQWSWIWWASATSFALVVMGGFVSYQISPI
jgi:hypothetical protein